MLLWYSSLCYDDIFLRHVVICSKRLSQLRRVCFDRFDFVIIVCSSHCMYLLLHSLKSFNFVVLSMKSLKLFEASFRHLVFKCWNHFSWLSHVFHSRNFRRFNVFNDVHFSLMTRTRNINLIINKSLSLDKNVSFDKSLSSHRQKSCELIDIVLNLKKSILSILFIISLRSLSYLSYHWEVYLIYLIYHIIEKSILSILSIISLRSLSYLSYHWKVYLIYHIIEKFILSIISLRSLFYLSYHWEVYFIYLIYHIIEKSISNARHHSISSTYSKSSSNFKFEIWNIHTCIMRRQSQYIVKISVIIHMSEQHVFQKFQSEWWRRKLKMKMKKNDRCCLSNSWLKDQSKSRSTLQSILFLYLVDQKLQTRLFISSLLSLTRSCDWWCYNLWTWHQDWSWSWHAFDFENL